MNMFDRYLLQYLLQRAIKLHKKRVYLLLYGALMPKSSIKQSIIKKLGKTKEKMIDS